MKKFQLKSALLTLLAVSFVALFSVGCGDDREDFVITGNNNVNNTGNLVFRFQQAAAPQTTVPTGTVALRFDLFAGNPPSSANFVETRLVDYADVVTLTSVPSNVTTITVTAIDANGFPTTVYQANDVGVVINNTVEVTIDNTTQVTLDSVTFTPDPVNLVSDRTTDGTQQLSAILAFSNGSEVSGPINNDTTTFTFASNEVANVSATGLVRQLDIGSNTTLTGSYSLGGFSGSDTIGINAFGFEAMPVGGSFIGDTSDYTAGWTNRFDDADGTILSNVTTTFALGTGAPAVLSVNSTTGDITNSGTLNNNDTFDVIVTWVDGRDPGTGLTFTDTVTFTVADPE